MNSENTQPINAGPENTQSHDTSAEFRSPTTASNLALAEFGGVASFPVQLLPLIKYEFDSLLLQYGAHYKRNSDAARIGRNPREYARELFKFFWRMQDSIDNNGGFAGSRKKVRPCLLSSAYFEWAQALQRIGADVGPQPWLDAEDNIPNSIDFYAQCRAVKELLSSDFSTYYMPEFREVLLRAAENLRAYLASHPCEALLIPYTLGYFEGVSTHSLPALDKKSFLCIHGLPYRLDWVRDGEHPVDFIVVWGDIMKRALAARGFDGDRILVSGHPSYSGRLQKPIRSSLDRVLVLGYAQMGAPLLNLPHYANRQLALAYAWTIQRCLKSINIQSATIRPHPSESPDWYAAHLDSAFWQVDYGSLPEAIERSSIIIGPTSTVMIDAGMQGVNYICYNPSGNAYNPFGAASREPDLPFDGSDPRVPVARDDESLCRALRDNATLKEDAISDYIGKQFRPEVILKAMRGIHDD